MEPIPVPDYAESREKLNKTLHDLSSTVRSLPDGEQFGQLKKGVADLKEAVRQVQLANAAPNRSMPSGNEDEVSREYVPGDGLYADREVRTLGAGGAVDVEKPYLGHEGEGVVRMVGSPSVGGEYDYGLLDDPEPKSQWQRKLQWLVEARSLARALRTNQRNSRVQPGSTPKLDRAILRHLRKGPPEIRRVFADNSGEGADWIPDVLMPELFRELELQRRVEALFGVIPLSTGGNTDWPFLTAKCQPFIVGQPSSGDMNPADIIKSVPSTSTWQLSPTTLGVHLPANRDATEDSIVAYLPFARQMLAEGLIDGFEDALINGDTGTHGDTGIAAWNPRSIWQDGLLGTGADHRYSFVGLRHQAIDRSADDDKGSAQTPEGLGDLLSVMNASHAMGNVVGLSSAEWILGTLLVDDALLTVDKYGDRATLLTGEVGRLFGKPILMSDFMDVELNASGIYDDSTKTKTGFLWVNRSRYWVGLRRDARLEFETSISNHVVTGVATMRKGFGTPDPSSVKNVAYAYNLTP